MQLSFNELLNQRRRFKVTALGSETENGEEETGLALTLTSSSLSHSYYEQ